MIRCLLLALLLTPTFLGCPPADARGAGWRARAQGVALEGLSLAPEQQAAVDAARRRHAAQLAELRNRLAAARIELEELFRDPAAAEQAIRIRAADVAALHEGIRSAVLDFRLEVRALLTPEQVRVWAPRDGGAGGWCW